MNTQNYVEQRSLGRQYLYELYSQNEGYQKLSDHINKFTNDMKTFSTQVDEHLANQNTTYDFETHAFRKLTKNEFNPATEIEIIRCSYDYLIYRLSDLAKNLFPDSKDKQRAVDEYFKNKYQKNPSVWEASEDYWEFCQNYKSRFMIFEKIQEKQFLSIEEKKKKFEAHQLYLKSDQYPIDLLKEQMDELNGQTELLHRDLQSVFKEEILFVRSASEFQFLIDIVNQHVPPKAYEKLKLELLKTLQTLHKCNTKQEFIEVNLNLLFDPDIDQCVNPDYKILFTMLTSFAEKYVEIHQELETSRATLVKMSEKLEALMEKRDANRASIEKAEF